MGWREAPIGTVFIRYFFANQRSSAILVTDKRYDPAICASSQYSCQFELERASQKYNSALRAEGSSQSYIDCWARPVLATEAFKSDGGETSWLGCVYLSRNEPKGEGPCAKIRAHPWSDPLAKTMGHRPYHECYQSGWPHSSTPRFATSSRCIARRVHLHVSLAELPAPFGRFVPALGAG
jgi:hypothetical protein